MQRNKLVRRVKRSIENDFYFFIFKTGVVSKKHRLFFVLNIPAYDLKEPIAKSRPFCYNYDNIFAEEKEAY